jgi:predicted peptidase
MMEAWRKLAKKESIALIAPELPRDAKFEPLAPKVFRCVVEDAKLAASLDPARIYLFGNSMGGYLTYAAAMLESQYFAAAAVHAMGIADDYVWIVARAARKTPMAIYIGDWDQLVPMEGVRKTKELLLKEGFSVHYVELKKHDHNYYAISEQINADAWNFLKELRLPAN